MPENPWEQRALELQQAGDLPATQQLEKDTPGFPAPPAPSANPWELRAQQLQTAATRTPSPAGSFEPVRPGQVETPEQRFAAGLTGTMKAENLGLPPQAEWAKLERKGIGTTLKDEWTGDNLIRKIPIVGLGPDIGDASAGLAIMARLKQDIAGKTPDGFTQGEWLQQRNAHIQFLKALQIKSDFAESQGYTFGGKVARVVSQLPTFAAEFWLSGPAAGSAKGAVTRALPAAAGPLLKRALVKAGTWGLQKAAGATARTGTALLARAVNNSLQRQLPDDIEVGPQGKIEFTGGDEAAAAWAKGFADTWIEALSEDLGSDITRLGRLGQVSALQHLSPTTRRAIKPFLSPLKSLKKAWMGSGTGRTSNEFARKLFGGVGFDGTIEEMLEERAGDVLRSVTGVEEKTIAEALFPGWEQLAVEAAAFAVPGAARQGVALAASVAKGEPGAKDRAKALAQKAQESDNEKMKQFAAKVEQQLEAGEEVEEGLLNRVIEAGETLEQAEQARAPEDTEATLFQAIEAEPLEATAPTLVQAREVEAPVAPPPTAAPPSVAVPEPAPPKPAKVEAKAPVVKPVAPEVRAAVEASEFAREQAQAAAEAGELEQEVRVKGKDIGVRVLASRASGKQDVGSTYTVRHKDFDQDIPLEQLLAAQIAEPDQSIGSLVSFLKGVREDAGPEIVGRALANFKETAPQTWKKRGKKLVDALEIQPTIPGSGVLPLEMVEPEFKRLRKLLTPGLAKQIMQDVTFWKEGLPINVTPQKLAAFADRAQLKPKRAVFLGQVSKQMEDKQLLEWIEAVLPKRAHKMTEAALKRVIKSRTPGERDRVIDAVNAMIEKHDRAVALQEVKKQLKAVRKSGLSEDNKERLEGLLEGISEKKPRPRTVRSAQALMDAVLNQIAKQVQAGMPKESVFVSIPENKIEKASKILADAEKKPLTDLTVDELRQLADGIQALIAQDKLKKGIVANNVRLDTQAAGDQSAREVNARHKKSFKNWGAQSLISRAIGSLTTKLSLAYENAESRAYRLAGRDATPHKILWLNRRNQGDENAEGLYRSSFSDYRAGMQSSNVSGKDMSRWSRVKNPVLATEMATDFGEGQIRKLTPAERIELYLNLMDPGTRAKIIRGDGVYLRHHRETLNMPLAAIERFVQDGLTANERRIAHVMSAVINGTRAITEVAGVSTEGVGAALNKTWTKLFGNPIATIQNYWSRSLKADESIRDPNKRFREEQRRFLDQHGPFQLREGGKQAVAIGDAFVKFDRMVRLMSAMAGRAEASHSAMRLLSNKNFRTAVTQSFRDGEGMLRLLEEDLLDWVSPQRSDFSTVGKIFNRLMRLVQIRTLAPKPTVVAYQTLSLPTAAMVIPPKYIAKSGIITTSNKQTRKEIDEHWALGSARLSGSGHDLVTPFSGSARMWREMGMESLGSKLEEASMSLIHGADTQVIYRIWRACKEWAKDDGFTGDALMRKTRERAQYAVDTTQPSTDIGSLSGLQKLARRSPFFKLIPGVLFSSQRNKLANLQIKELSDWAAEGWSPRTAHKHIARSSLISVLNALGLATIAGTTGIILAGVPDTPEERQKAMLRFFTDFLGRLWGNWILGGDLLSMAMRRVEVVAADKPPFYADTPDNILEATVNDIGTAFDHLARAMLADDPDKYERNMTQFRKRALRGVGLNDINKILKRWEEKK